MTHAIDTGLAVLMAGSLLYIGLGIWVLTLTPRRRQTTLVGGFAVLIGLIAAPGTILQTLHLISSSGLSQQVLAALFWNLAWLVALALAVHTPAKLKDRRLLGTAVGAGLVVAANGAIYTLIVQPSLGVHPLIHAVSHVGVAAEAAALALLALRARPARTPSRTEVTQLAILTVALVLLNGFVDGQDLIAHAAGLTVTDPSAGLLTLLAEFDEILIVAGIWAWNMVRAPPETVDLHRGALLGILAPITAGAIYQAVFPGFVPDLSSLSTAGADPITIVVHGIIRTLGVGLLAYGILRHDLAGLDAKVRFGVSKTTVAGVFVAVFFIVSEGAQAIFADFAGNELIGVIAAGALVFAISPLQRLADRFAAKAVPGGAQAGADAEERYRREIEVALADDQLTRDEELHLARRADELGIATERAFELQEEVQGQLGRDAADGDAGP